MTNWISLNDKKFGLMNILSNFINEMEAKTPNILPNLRLSDTMFVFSDYGGQHKASNYEIYSFLYVDINHCQIWFKEREEIRKRYLSDGRRISFKTLKDKKKAKIVYRFLSASDYIPGLLINFVIDKQIESVFKTEGKIDTNSPELQKYHKWKNKTFEHLLRIVHFNCFCIAGLSKQNQDIYWITDDDDIVANASKLIELTDIFGHVLSSYVSHNLRHIRFGSTGITDDGSRKIEDFCAIPDLAAGALSELLSIYKKDGVGISNDLIVPIPKVISGKSLKILNWLSTQPQNLKRLTCMIEPIESSTTTKITWLKIIGTNNFG